MGLSASLELADHPLLQKLCLQMYFHRVNPSFPIFHAPTFRPTQENGFLLLALCALGCLFLGTEEAARYGATLFERILRAMMTSVRNWPSFHPVLALLMMSEVGSCHGYACRGESPYGPDGSNRTDFHDVVRG